MNDDALYLEADEDITSAIDKLKKSAAASVQIVVPKRSTMLQSIINLKLLKKAAESSKKQLVLVTNDKIATDLAARVGLAVAPSLGAKAVVAKAAAQPQINDEDEVIDDSEPAPLLDPEDTKQASPAPPPAKPKKLFLKRREVPDPVAPAAAGVAAGGEDADAVPDTEAGATADPPRKGPKVPNYRKLQRRVLWLVVGAVLLGAAWASLYLFTGATVILYANGAKSSIDTNFIVDPNGATDQSAGVLAGKEVTASKDLTGPLTPTGKKDAGTKATGTITISNCLDSNEHTFVTGTRFMAPDGKIFRSLSDVVVPGGQGSFFGCTTPGTATVTVQADQNGDSYNEGPATYTMPGLPTSQQTGQNSITSKGAQMSGGTSKTVTVVTQADVDSALAALLDKDKDNAARDLSAKVPSGHQILNASQATKTSEVTPTPAIDAEATAATVTFKVTYTALAVKTSEFKSIIQAQEEKQIGPSSQIYDDGLVAAQITASQPDANGKITFHFTTEAYSGTKIDTAKLTKDLAGKRYGDAIDLAGRQPSVSHVEITLQPAWSFSLPTRSDKIKVSIKVTNNR